MRALFVLLILMLAGCAEAPEPASTPAPEPEPQPLLSAPVNQSIALPETSLLTELREFHWATAASAESMVVRIRVDFGTGNQCSLGGGRAGTFIAGPTRIFLREREDGTGTSTSSGGELAHAQAGPVDTRGQAGSGHSSGTSTSSGPWSGEATLTLGGRALEPWDSSLMPGVTLALSIQCSKPFDIADAHWGPQFHAWDDNNMVGAASAGAPVASATLTGSDTVDLTGDYGRIVSAGFGYQAGRLTLTADQEQAGGLPGDRLSLEAGPGAYGFEVDRAAAVADSFWIAAYSLHEPLDLSVGRLDASAMPRFS